MPVPGSKNMDRACGIVDQRRVHDAKFSLRVANFNSLLVMKLGIVIYSNDPETVWNAFRLGVFSLKHDDAVSVFLLGKGVEAEALEDARFDVKGQMRSFVDAGGRILACGTCLKIRNAADSGICPVSTMQDLHAIICDSDRVLTF